MESRCVQNSTLNGTARECVEQNSSKEEENDTDMTLYVAMGIVIGSLLFIAILGIDFAFHIRRRLKSKRYQKRRHAYEMGQHLQRPAPFLSTSSFTGHSLRGYTNEAMVTGLKHPYSIDQVSADGVTPNGKQGRILPSLSTSLDYTRQSKTRRIFPECLRNLSGSDPDHYVISEKTKRRKKRRIKRAQLDTDTKASTRSDQYGFGENYNKNITKRKSHVPVDCGRDSPSTILKGETSFSGHVFDESANDTSANYSILGSNARLKHYPLEAGVHLKQMHASTQYERYEELGIPAKRSPQSHGDGSFQNNAYVSAEDMENEQTKTKHCSRRSRPLPPLPPLPIRDSPQSDMGPPRLPCIEISDPSLKEIHV